VAGSGKCCRGGGDGGGGSSLRFISVTASLGPASRVRFFRESFSLFIRRSSNDDDNNDDNDDNSSDNKESRDGGQLHGS